MAMNIKSDEAERLTRELASLTGETLTTAVSVAVRERLERLRAAASVDTEATARRVLELGRQIAGALPEPWATEDHGSLLYDEAGLPR